MSLSTLNNSFIPYSLSGLSNINTDTINGISAFNGVSTSGAYQLSYNTTTGILSMQPIGQLLETTSGPTFNNINLNTTGTITSGAYGLFLTTTSQYIQLFNNGSYARILFTSLAPSSSNNDLPIFIELATLRKVKAIPPPMIIS